MIIRSEEAKPYEGPGEQSFPDKVRVSLQGMIGAEDIIDAYKASGNVLKEIAAGFAEIDYFESVAENPY